MSKKLFEIGVVFAYRTRKTQEYKTYITNSVTKTKIKASDIKSSKEISFDSINTESMIKKGNIKFLKYNNDNKGIAFSELSKKDQERALQKFNLINGLLNKGVKKVSKKPDTLKLIKKLSVKFGFAKTPHWQTVRKWLKKLQQTGKINSLYDSTSKKGTRKSRLPSLTDSIIEEEIDRFFTPSNPRISTICYHIETRIFEHNLSHPDDVKKVPARNTIVYRINKKHNKDKQKRELGKSKAKLDLANASVDLNLTRVLEKVEIDHTPLDIHLLDDNEKTLIGRPTLTLLLDKYSSMVLGFNLSFESPSYAAVANACNNAFVEKSEFIKKLGIKGKWPAHGIPELIVTDNGNEFWGKYLKQSAFEFGSVIQYSPVKTPTVKGSVERFFEKINTRFLDQLPGVIRKPNFSNPEYKPGQNAVLTFSEFKKLFTDWIVNIHHNEPTNRESKTPLELWSSSSKTHPIPNEDPDQIQLYLLATKEKTLKGSGIILEGLYYNSNNLKSLYQRLGKTKLRIKFDPFDLGEILVFDPENLVYLKVPCTDQAYATGLSSYEHRLYKNEAKKIIKEKLSNEDLIRARIRMKKETDRAIAKNKRRKTQVTTQKNSRIQKVGVEKKPLNSRLIKPLAINDDIPLNTNGWETE